MVRSVTNSEPVDAHKNAQINVDDARRSVFVWAARETQKTI